jgi:hypothetical protein
MAVRGVLAGVLFAAVASAGWAQDQAAAAIETDVAAQQDEELLDEGQLDDLVAPVALYPDALLAQVLVAATYPIDIVKAERWLADNPDLDDKERAGLAEGEDWDPSVQVLAGGFPTVVDQMAEDIDWTENLGDAMLAQTDDLLDAVQRQRARAAAAGNLESNDAQLVETSEDDQISIQPADPGVVYVPSYDATAAYQPVGTAVTTGTTTGQLLTTGAIAFGSALLINEIFDDDNDNWDDYWRGPPPINWADDDLYPRRGINAGRDVNIDVDRNRNRVRIGDRDAPIADRNGAWTPDPKRRDAARDKLAARGDRAGAQKARDKVAARGDRPGAGAKGGGGGGDARAKLEAAAAARKITPGKGAGKGGGKIKPPAKAGGKVSALKPGAGGQKSKAALDRGAQSKKRDTSKVATKARASGAGHAKAISKPKQHAKAPPRKPAAKRSALKKPSGGGKHAKAASHRGGAHAGKVKRR